MKIRLMSILLIMMLFVLCLVLNGQVIPDSFNRDLSIDKRDIIIGTNDIKATGDSLNCTLVGGWFPEPCYAVFVKDTIAYMGDGGYVKILNIKDVTNPQLLAEISVPSIVRDIFIKDSLAYVANDWGGIRIINISDPTTPIETGFYDTNGNAYGVYVIDTFAYVADDVKGLRIINVSDLANPIETGFYDTNGNAYGVYVIDTLAYIVDGNNGLIIVNVSDPVNPVQVGYYDTASSALGVYVVDTLAYVADYADGLRIINISDPTTPLEIGFYDTNSYAYGVYVVDTFAYVADRNDGLRIINVSDPTTPLETGFYNTNDAAKKVHVIDAFAYIADQWSGLRIIKVSDPINPIEIGFYDDTNGYARGVHIVDTLAYIANGNDGLSIINVSDPTKPIEIGFYDTNGNAYGVYVIDKFAYVADGNDGLRIINVSDPTNPVQMGYYDTASGALSVYVVDTYAYVADQNDGIRIIDVSDPTNPTEIGFYDTGGQAYDVYVIDTFAYVADLGQGLRIINVSDPTNPIEIGFYNTGWALEVYVVDTFAYVANGSGLKIINVSDPVNPVETGLYNTGNYAHSVYVVDIYAYVADYADGIRIIDVSDPANPTEIGFYDTHVFAEGVHVVDKLAYVTDGDDGLYIIQFIMNDLQISYLPRIYGYKNEIFNVAVKNYLGESLPNILVTISLPDGQILENLTNTSGIASFNIYTETDGVASVNIPVIPFHKAYTGNFNIIIHEMYVIHTEELGVLREENILIQVKGGPIYPENPDYIPTPLLGATVSINNELDISYSGITGPTGIVTTNENTSYTKKMNIEVTKETYRTYTGTIEPYMWSYSEKATGPNNGNNIIRFSETGELCMTYYQYNPNPDPFIPPRIKRVIEASSTNNGDWWYVWDKAYGQNPSMAITEGTIDGIFYDNGAGYIYDNAGLPNPGTVINGSIFVEAGSMWSNNITNLLHSSGIMYLGNIIFPHLVHAVFPYDDPENAEVEVLIYPDGELTESGYLVIPAHNPSICMFSNINTTENEPIIAFEDINSEICWKWYRSNVSEWYFPERKSFSIDQISRNPHIDAYGDNISLVWEEEIATGADEYRIYLDNSRFFGDNTETDKKYPKVKRGSYISFVEEDNTVNMWYYKDNYSKKINLISSGQDISYPDFEVKTRLVRPFLTEHTVYYMFTESAGDIYKIRTGKEIFTTNDLIQPLFDMALIDTIEDVYDSPLYNYIPSSSRPVERLSSTVKGFDENRYYELIVTTTNNNQNTPYVLLIDGEAIEVIYGKDNEVTVPVLTENILDNELIVSLDRVKGNPNRTIDIKLYEYDEKAEEETIGAANTMLKPFKTTETTTPFSVVNRGIQTGNYQLEVNVPDNSVVKIGIYDIMGREVNSMTKELIKGKNILNIKKTDKHNNELSKGVYFIKVETDNNSYSGKLINLK